MSTYAKLAVAAVAVIVAGAIGLALLTPGPAPGVGGPATSPSPSPRPTPAASPSPTVPPYAPPPVTGSFTSDIHGFSMSYPEGWRARAATEPWPTSSLPTFDEPHGDILFDPVRMDHLFLAVASQPLDGRSLNDFATGLSAQEEGCEISANVTVDGIPGLFSDCGEVYVAADDRGYAIRVQVSDDPDFYDFHYLQWLVDEVLPTIQLDPANAIDRVPSASP
jgi:hypothetical protein